MEKAYIIANIAMMEKQKRLTMIVIHNEISYYNRQYLSRLETQTTRWFLNNLLHREDDHPAYIGRGYEEKWEYGKQVHILKYQGK